MAGQSRYNAPPPNAVRQPAKTYLEAVAPWASMMDSSVNAHRDMLRRNRQPPSSGGPLLSETEKLLSGTEKLRFEGTPVVFTSGLR